MDLPLIFPCVPSSSELFVFQRFTNVVSVVSKLLRSGHCTSTVSGSVNTATDLVVVVVVCVDMMRSLFV